MNKILHVVKTTLKYWLPVAVAVTGVYLLVAGAAQQNLRQNADDPQIQLAEDTAAKLAAGQSVQAVLPTDKVNIAKSLAPYIIIFDANGQPIAASAQLDGQMPTIPSGVFNSVRQSGTDKFTWQPRDGVRSAVTVTQFKEASSGFVLAGRSLREVERREDAILQLLNLGLFAILVGTFLVTAILFRNSTKDVSKTNEAS